MLSLRGQINMLLKKFEFEVIKTLLSNPDLLELFKNESKDHTTKFEETGYGYFLTIFDSKLPKERAVYDKPFLIGKSEAGDEMGFILFVENHELTIECHGFGGPLPKNLRDKNIHLQVVKN